MHANLTCQKMRFELKSFWSVILFCGHKKKQKRQKHFEEIPTAFPYNSVSFELINSTIKLVLPLLLLYYSKNVPTVSEIGKLTKKSLYQN